MFEEEKKFESWTWFFFFENSSIFGVLGQGKDFKLTTELSEKVEYPHHQAIKNELNEAILSI